MPSEDNAASLRPLAVIAIVLAVLMGVVVCGVIVAGVIFANRARQDAAEQIEAVQQQIDPSPAGRFLEENLLTTIQFIESDIRGDATVISILDAAADRLEGRFEDAPAAEAEVRLTLGAGYDDTGEDEKAAIHLRRGLDLLTLHGSENTTRTVDAMRRLAAVLARQDEIDEARSWGERAVALARRSGLHRSPAALAAQLLLADLALGQGMLAQAESQYGATLESAQAAQGDHGRLTLEAYDALADVCEYEHRYREAAAIRHRVLDVRRSDLGGRSPEAVRTMAALGRAWSAGERLDRARPLIRSAVETSRAAFGKDDPITLACMAEFAVLLHLEDNATEANATFLMVLETQRAVLGDDHPDTLRTKRGYAAMLADDDRADEAAVLLEAAIRSRKAAMADRHPAITEDRAQLAGVLMQLGRNEEAADLCAEVYDAYLKGLGEAHPRTIDAVVTLGEAMLAAGRVEEAGTISRSVLDREQSRLGPSHPDVLRIMAGLIRATGPSPDRDRLLEEYGRRSAVWAGEDVGISSVDELR